MALELPDFPWNALVPYADRARAHADGIVDLSVGSPVDPTPEVVRAALDQADDAPGYPTTIGTPALQDAIIGWYDRRRGVDLERPNVLPTVGSKEFIALLPTALGLGPGDVVVHPEVAYPTYAIGAAIQGATALAADDPADWPAETKLIWLNSPGNPDGHVDGIERLRAAVDRARELGAVIVSDECYAELAWDGETVNGGPGEGTSPSILDRRVIGESRRLTLAIGSLSKQSNLAGYRAAFAVGCSDLIGQLREVRKHMGLMVPGPVQAAMIAALSDDAHVAAQRERYRVRRDTLRPALEAAGFRIDASHAGLYLWATRDDDCWTTVDALADLGILVAPGSFYGVAGERHVRVALTASDERIAEAARRLSASA